MVHGGSAGSDGSDQFVDHRSLTGRLSAALELNATLLRDIKRRDLLLSLVRSVYRLGESPPFGDDLAPQFLKAVIEHTLCDVAVLFRRVDKSWRFRIIRHFGYTACDESLMILENMPAFGTVSAETCPQQAFFELQRRFAVASMLWAMDSVSGLALLIAAKDGATIPFAYDASGREVIETALALYVDVLGKWRVNRALLRAKQSSEIREVLREGLVMEIRRSLGSNCDELSEYVDRVRSAPEIVGNSEVLSYIRELGEIADDSRATLQMADQIFGLEDEPVELNFSLVDLNEMIATVIQSTYVSATAAGVDVTLQRTQRNLNTNLDRAWFQMALRTILSQIILVTPTEGRVELETGRQSDGSLVVKFRWPRGSKVCSRSSKKQFEFPLPLEAIVPLIRIVESHGAILTCEAHLVSGNVLILTLPFEDFE